MKRWGDMHKSKNMKIFLCLFILFIVIAVFIAKRYPDDPWRLNAFEAMINDDLSICSDDEYCLEHTRYYKSVICVADLCEKNPEANMSFVCAPEFARQYTSKQQALINVALCSMLKSPSATARKKYLSLVKNEKEYEAVELIAYLMALRGSSENCINYIKEFVGPYGSSWNFSWYRALSGCRILAKERTRSEEENDFKVWLKATCGRASCTNIKNREMREACKTNEAASPTPEYDQLW